MGSVSFWIEFLCPICICEQVDSESSYGISWTNITNVDSRSHGELEWAKYVRGEIMYLFFADESGNPYCKPKVLADLISPNSSLQPWYFLGGISIHERLRPVIADYFLRMKEAFFPGWDPYSLETEIKGIKLHDYVYLVQTHQWLKNRPPTGPWSALKPTQVISLYQGIFDILKKARATVYVTAINQRTLYSYCKRRAKPYSQANYHALALLQQRACQFLEYETGRAEQGMFITDRHSNLQMDHQYDQFLSMRDQINATASWPVVFNAHLLEEPVSVDSHVVPLIQLADVVTYAVAKGVKKGTNHPWFREVEPHLARRYSTDDYMGVGLELVPRWTKLKPNGQAY